jgi:arylsulfatase A-like enzyme
MSIISRRHLIAGLAAAAALTALPVWTQEPAKPAAPRQPNLLIIHCDQLNFRTLGCYREQLPPNMAFVWGEKTIVKTPNIDSLAKAGAICNKFYTTSPVCTPSRAALLTGRYPQNTGAISNNKPFANTVITFAEILRLQGYATGYAGKWHLDGGAKPGWAPKRQFGFEDNTYMFNRGHWKKLEDTAKGPMVSGGENERAAKSANEKSFTTDFLADKAVEFIKTHKQRPFCYMVSFPDPHTPRTVRAPYDTMFKELYFEKPRSAREDGEGLPSWGTTLNGAFGSGAPDYFGMVKCIDDNVGKILKELREDGLMENTFVVFTADHGDMCGEHGRNAKGIPFEASAKIPFLITAPGKIKPGTVIAATLGNVDFKPTIQKLLGLPADSRDEGRDASALFITGKIPNDWSDITFVRIGESSSGWLGAFTGQYKLVVSPRAIPCLFDLEKDPNEMKNRFQLPECRDTVRALAKALKDYGVRRKDPLAQDPIIRADLDWAADGIGDYVPVPRSRIPEKATDDE